VNAGFLGNCIWKLFVICIYGNVVAFLAGHFTGVIDWKRRYFPEGNKASNCE